MNCRTVPPARTLSPSPSAVPAAHAFPASTAALVLIAIVTCAALLIAPPIHAAPLPAGMDDPPPATLPMRMDVDVQWDIDEDDTVNKGSMTARYRGTLKIDAESSSYTHDMPTRYTTYTAGEVNVTYTYKETRTEKEPPPGCPPLKAQYDGGGSFRLMVVQSPGGSALHVHRVATFVPREMMVFAPPEVREMIIDYYDFFALARDQTVRGKIRRDCRFEPAEKDIGFAQATLRFRIADDGEMTGERSWSSHRENGPADFQIRLSDLPESMEDEQFHPANDPAGNVSYTVSWTFGEVEPLVEIQRREHGNWVPLGGDPVDVKVGEKIELRGKVMPEERDREKGDWTVPGKRVKGFKVEGDTGKKDELTGGDLKETPTVAFHWYDGEDGLEVKYATKSTDGESLEATATFNAQEPELKMRIDEPSCDFVVADVKWKDDDGLEHTDRELLCDAPEASYSIRFHHDPLPAEFPGRTQYVQVVDTQGLVRRSKHARTRCDMISRAGLDSSYPYCAGPEATDRPGADIESLDLLVEVMHQFRMSLMYKPDSEGAIFVPIREAEWWWGGRARRVDEYTDNWSTTGSDMGSHGCDVEAGDFLEWDRVARKDDPWEGCE